MSKNKFKTENYSSEDVLLKKYKHALQYGTLLDWLNANREIAHMPISSFKQKNVNEVMLLHSNSKYKNFFLLF